MMTAYHATYQIIRTGASTLPTDCVQFGHFFGEIWMHNIVSTTQIYLIIIAIIYYTYTYITHFNGIRVRENFTHNDDKQ